MFFEDITKKVTDLFDKGYSHKVPFTFKVDSKDNYFMNFVHKTEFNVKDKGLDLDWEYKIKKDKANVAGSFLGSNKKAEVEFEYEPLGLKTADTMLRLRLKETVTSNPNPEEVAQKKLWSYMKYWNVDSEVEAKFKFAKELGHTLKLNCDGKNTIPKAKFTTLFNRAPLLMGLSYTFDPAYSKYTGPLEVLLGATPYKNFTTYLRHEVTNFAYPGKVAIGIHDREVFDLNWDKKTKEGVKNKTYHCPAEFALEASVDLNNANKFAARGAAKLISGPKYTFQTMYDSDFKLTSAFTYIPKKGFKLIWSDQLDTKKLVTDPKGGIGYTYGFTLELGL